MMLGKNPLKGIKDMLNTNLCNYIPGFKNHLSEFKSVLNINNLYLENESQVWTLICYQFGLNTKQIKSFF